MYNKSLLALSLLLTCVACEKIDHPHAGKNVDPRGHTGGDLHTGYDADNTGRNVRDRDQNTLTPTDQKENEVDVTTTQNIRKALMNDKALSTNAKNIKIITRNGVVTLRGPVNSQSELDSVLKIVNSAKGNAEVNNHLEITKNP